MTQTFTAVYLMTDKNECKIPIKNIYIYIHQLGHSHSTKIRGIYEVGRTYFLAEKG